MRGGLRDFQDQETVKHYADARAEGNTKRAKAIRKANPDLATAFDKADKAG